MVAVPVVKPGIAIDPEVEKSQDFDREFLTQRFPPHKVVVHDDDHTPMDSVVKIFLKAVPGMTTERAQALMMEVHTTGSAIPFVGPKERAEHVGAIIRTIGIKVTVESDD
ncbi:MAG: ATP-dependent Clp protease adaptor ClpS [Chloroflexota bacterium]